ncbi:hypothetical protein Tco_0584453 [Tanacetum coccineum]
MWFCENNINLKVMEEQLRLLVGSHRASTPPSSSPRPSTPLSYSLGPSRLEPSLENAERSNCKFLTGKIKVLDATLEMEMHPENHTLDSTAVLHKLYNDMGKFVLENDLEGVELKQPEGMYPETCAPISITKDFKAHFCGTQTQWSLLDDDFVDLLHLCYLDRYQYEETVDLKEARKVWVRRSMVRCRGTWAMVTKNYGILESWMRRSMLVAEIRKKVPEDVEGEKNRKTSIKSSYSIKAADGVDLDPSDGLR